MTHKISRRRFMRTASVGAAAVGIAGCTGGGAGGGGDGGGDGGMTGGTPTPSQGTKWIPGDVLTAAREEGQAVLYGTIDQPDQTDTIKPRFEEEFPEISFRGTGISTSEVATKLNSETRADAVRVDVALYSQGTLRSLAKTGVHEEFPSDHWLKQQANEMGYPGPLYEKPVEFPGYGLPYTLAYNQEMVSESEAPDTYKEVGDAKWEDAVALDNPANLSAGGGLYATLYAKWGEQEWIRQVDRLMSNNPILTATGSTENYRLMSQGERMLDPAQFINDLVQQLAEGEDTPVRMKWLDPALQVLIPMAAVRGAPHPNAGLVFMSWLLSEAGQTAIADTGRVPNHPATASTHASFEAVIPGDVEILPTGFNNPTYQGENYIENPDAFVPLFNEHFQ